MTSQADLGENRTDQPRSLRTFFVVWIGQIVSVVGSSLTGFGLAIWLFVETGSVAALAGVMLANTVPGVLLAPAAGAYVDRGDRRMVMLGADAISGLTTLVIALLFLTDSLELWHIYAMVTVNSSARSFQEPAYMASVPLLVPTEHLGRANGLVQMGDAIGMLAAPALAGVLIATSGLWGILLVDFVSFGVAVATLAFVRIPRPLSSTAGRASQGSIREEALEGWRFLRARHGLLGLLVMYAALNFVLGFTSVLYIPLFLGFTSEVAAGVAISISGIGMLVGTLVMGAWGGPQRRVLGITVWICFAGAALALAGLRPSWAVITVAAFLLMLSLPIINATSQTLWQTKVEADLQGRVFSLRRMLAQFAAPAAYLLAGPLADGIFEPAMTRGGSLAGTVGQVIGTGPGRGIGLMFVVIGLLTVATALVGYSYSPIRNLESDLPNVSLDVEPATT